MRLLAFLLLFLALATASNAVVSVSTTTNPVITFNFGADYTVGTYIDGMPYVVDPGGGVIINSITPAYDPAYYEPLLNSGAGGFVGVNGFEANPVTEASSGSGDLQSFDQRYKASTWTPPLSLPRTYPAGTSIIKSASVVTPTSSICGGNPNTSCTLTYAVLTVVASAPPANSFRPPYVGTAKPVYSASSLDIAGDLPSLADIATTPTWAAVDALRGDGGTPTMHHHGYIQGVMMGTNNFINIHQANRYSCAYGDTLNSAMLRTMQSGSVGDKDNTVYWLVQMGIDAYYATLNGKNFSNLGGCVNPGWKSLILYAGHMLRDQGGDAFWATYLGAEEDTNVWKPSGGEALFGCRILVSASQCGPLSVAQLDCEGSQSHKRIDDGLRDGGACAFGSAMGTICSNPCSDADTDPQPTLDEQRAAGFWSLTYYQGYTSPRFGSGAVARIMGLQEEWGYDPFFEYLDRLASPPWNGACSQKCYAYEVDMYKAYAASVAPTLGLTVTSDPDPPSSVTSPLGVVFTASVTGTQTGTIDYKIDCDDTDGTWDQEETASASEVFEFSACDYLTNGRAEIQVCRPTGCAGETETTFVNVTIEAVPATPTISSLTIYDPDDDQSLGTLANGATINRNENLCIALFPNTSPGIGGFKWEWTPPAGVDETAATFRQTPYTETTEPFCFSGDSGWIDVGSQRPNCLCDYTNLNVVGEHTITAHACDVAYVAGTCTGNESAAFTRTFTVVDETPSGNPSNALKIRADIAGAIVP